jgi:DNA-directed RNA polymerase subunit RPC12/RpoP
MTVSTKRTFPCPLCSRGLEVRQSKKQKPYVVCDPCGVQLFVRSHEGISAFERLIARGQDGNAWQRLKEMEARCLKKCPKCGRRFWIGDADLETSWFDGQFVGFRCPEKGCKGLVKPGATQ